MTEPRTWTHPEYQWTDRPRTMIAVRSSDGSGWKTRAMVVLETFKPYYSHRLGHVVSPAKFAKFQAAMDRLQEKQS